jgi:hypothetical protein
MARLRVSATGMEVAGVLNHDRFSTSHFDAEMWFGIA